VSRLRGHRFNHETLEVKFKEKNIAELLEMDIQQAIQHFENIPKIHHLLQTLAAVGLDYLKLGQPSPTLSGGEAQRIKLARELGKRSTGGTIYLLDEPTTGLHFVDIQKLLEVLHGFVNDGNTVLVVEHNLDVIKTADWVIDLGPEGGSGGGRVIVAGTPEDVANCAESHTGRALAEVLWPDRVKHKTALAPAAQRLELDPGKIVVRGAAQHNLQKIDIEIPRDQMNVFCGPSGSGKTSLAMDTLYAEGQRRYVESLSAYARQFLGQMPKPRLDHISGLSPSIAIEQKTVGHTPRSTVGTVTEIYDYLRILFARLGKPYCPACEIPVQTQTTDEVIEKILAFPAGTRLLLLSPQEVPVGASYDQLWEKLGKDGYSRVRINGVTLSTDGNPRDGSAAQASGGNRRRSSHRRSQTARTTRRFHRIRFGSGAWRVTRITYCGRQRRNRLAGRSVQPPFCLRTMWPQFRGIDAAQLFVQLVARLVPGVPGTGNATGDGRLPHHFRSAKVDSQWCDRDAA
jgi:excinuclease ABC subunit A